MVPIFCTPRPHSQYARCLKTWKAIVWNTPGSVDCCRLYPSTPPPPLLSSTSLFVSLITGRSFWPHNSFCGNNFYLFYFPLCSPYRMYIFAWFQWPKLATRSFHAPLYRAHWWDDDGIGAIRRRIIMISKVFRCYMYTYIFIFLYFIVLDIVARDASSIYGFIALLFAHN